MKLKNLLSITIIFIVLLCCTMYANAAEIVESGTCGATVDNLTWTLDDTGTLTISGTGAMANYSQTVGPRPPWDSCGQLYTAVVIENGVTTVGEDAFAVYPFITSITLPNSLTSIGDNAFMSSAITDITIPQNVTSIGSSAFSNCANLKSVVIPCGITSIGNGTFRGCTNLKSLTIHNTITNFGESAFSGCNSLTDIYFCGTEEDWNNIIIESYNEPLQNATTYFVIGTGDCGANRDSVTWVLDREGLLTISGTGAMTNYSQTLCIRPPWDSYGGLIKSVIINSGVTTIGDDAFFLYPYLENIIIADSVTSIGANALYGSSITSIIIPQNLTSIGSGAFYKCNNLKTIYYCGTEEDWNNIIIESYNEPLQNATVCLVIDAGACGANSSNVFWTLDDTGTLTISGTGAMANYSQALSIRPPWESYGPSLRTIIIENGVTTVGKDTFGGYIYISNITIPNSVSTIGEYAFSGCSNLTTINYYGTEEDWNNIYIASGNECLAIITPTYITSPYTVTKAEISGSQCTFDFKIETSTTASGTLLVMIYSEADHLIGIRTCSVDLSSGIVKQSDFTVDFVGIPYQYKIFLWQDLTTIKPIMESHSKLF